MPARGGAASAGPRSRQIARAHSPSLAPPLPKKQRASLFCSARTRQNIHSIRRLVCLRVLYTLVYTCFIHTTPAAARQHKCRARQSALRRSPRRSAARPARPRRRRRPRPRATSAAASTATRSRASRRRRTTARRCRAWRSSSMASTALTSRRRRWSARRRRARRYPTARRWCVRVRAFEQPATCIPARSGCCRPMRCKEREEGDVRRGSKGFAACERVIFENEHALPLAPPLPPKPRQMDFPLDPYHRRGGKEVAPFEASTLVSGRGKAHKARRFSSRAQCQRARAHPRACFSAARKKPYSGGAQ